MSISGQDDFLDEDDDLPPPQPRRKSRDGYGINGRKLRHPAAENMAKQFGGEPEDWDEDPAYAEFDDAKLTQIGFVLKATYAYRDLRPKTLYEVLRYEHESVPGEKRFLQRMQAGETVARRRFFATRGLVVVPYRWPEIAAHKGTDLYYFEGEKDADRAASDGLLSTTLASQYWTPTIVRAYSEFDTFLAFEDNDDKGRKNALNAARRMSGRVRLIKIIRLPGLGPSEDYSDWRNAGHTLEELAEVIAKTPEWEEKKARLFNPADWGDTPPPTREFLADPLLPDRNVSLLYGDGGNGKSLLALQLATARAIGAKWINLETIPGRTLILSAEDDLEELHRRLFAIAAYYKTSVADLKAIRLVDLVGQDAVIGELARSGRIVATELYQFMLDAVADFRPGLVIVDALADSFAGDENNRTQARQFISMLRRPALEHRCAFLTIAHPSLSGIVSGRGTSGSTGWSNSVRARMYLETHEVEGKEPDPNIKVLRQPKANYAAGGWEMILRYENGVLVPTSGGAPLSRGAKEIQAEEVFMTILTRLFNEERFVSASRGPNYAPAIFATEPEAAEATVSKTQLNAAMVRLFQKKRISNQPYGSPSRGKTRIVEAAM